MAEDQQEPLVTESVKDAAEKALQLLGNANAKAILERQKMILSAIHPELSSYATVDQDDPASSTLFGASMRDRIKANVDFNNELNKLTKSFRTNQREELNLNTFSLIIFQVFNFHLLCTQLNEEGCTITLVPGGTMKETPEKTIRRSGSIRKKILTRTRSLVLQVTLANHLYLQPVIVWMLLKWVGGCVVLCPFGPALHKIRGF